MPTFDEELRDRIRDAGPRAPSQDDLFEGLARRKRQRARARKVGAIVTVGVVLAGTLAAFAIADASRTGPKPMGEPTPTSSPSELGLLYPVCDVSTMPIGLGMAQGLAAVFTRATDGCPKRLDKDTFVGVGVDLDGDGALDATAGPIPDCFMLCEAFAAPDVNGDGIAEVAVSTAGADGYGIWLYAVSTSPPAIAQITDGTEPFTFPWVNVATHADAAHCETNGAGQTTVVLDHSEWDASGSTVVQESFAISGVTATKLDQQRLSVPLEQTPTPTDELCGAPVHGSAEGSMGGPPRLEGRDIGVGTNVCDVERLGNLDIIPDGVPDVAFTGFFINDVGQCPKDMERQTWIVAVDVTGDDKADASTDARLVNCPATGCSPLDATDLDADGDGELIINTAFSIVDQGYFSVTGHGDGVTIEPILVAYPGHPEAGIQPGDPLMTSAGGDAGFGSWIRCENYPSSPVLVQLLADGVVDSNLPTKWHEVKFRLEPDGMFHVIGSTDLSLPVAQDPGLIRSTAPACGVDFNPFV
jgi:hypothetical protein